MFFSSLTEFSTGMVALSKYNAHYIYSDMRKEKYYIKNFFLRTGLGNFSEILSLWCSEPHPSFLRLCM